MAQELDKKSRDRLFSKLANRIKTSSYTEIVIAAVAMVIAFLLVVLVTRFAYAGHMVFTSVVSNINIMLITTNATMIGLYVTAFIFLNDSLKSRVKDDPTISDAVNDILYTYRKNMVILAIGTILVIVATLSLNLFLNNTGFETADHATITFSDNCWWGFLLCTAASIFVIIWIILSSRDITNSDKLIYKYSQKVRYGISNDICDAFDNIVEKAEQSDAHDRPAGADERRSEREYLYIINNSTGEIELNPAVNYKKEFLEDLPQQYGFVDAYKKARKSDFSKNIPTNIPPSKLREYEIELGKIVRLLENLIGRISDNNIDKSIMNTDYKIDSIKSGFLWLYAGEQSSNSSSVEIIDVRDQNRFLDHVKYKIITDRTFEELPFNNRAVEKVFDYVRLLYHNLSFGDKKALIKDYKDDTRKIIDEFFTGYKNIVAYRDAMVHQMHHINGHGKQDNADDKAKPIAESSVDSDAAQPSDKKTVVYNSADPNIVKVVNYAKLLRRVLLDRFMSFVRTDDLSQGNSTMDKGWFNYSELTNSNFTHSSFKYACLENAIFRECDLSTCSFIMADASATDFYGSNFSYSDLTGMDLQDANLNRTQMNSVLLRDERVDTYYKGIHSLIDNDTVLTQNEFERQEWLKSICDNNDSDEKAKIIRDKYAYYRSGAPVGEIARLIIGDRVVKNDDESAAILLGDGCGKTVLDASYAKISDHLVDYVNYRKFSKINDKLFGKFDELRSKEAKGKTDKGRSLKELRETEWGKVYFCTANLKKASINNAFMSNIDFSHVPMSVASYRDSDLSGADMYYTDADDVMFFRTNLIGLDAYRANFNGANFNEATLIGANILDTNLNGTNFKKAILQNTKIIKTPDAFTVEMPNAGDADEISPIYLARGLENKAAAQSGHADNAPPIRLYELLESHRVTSDSRLDKDNAFSACNSDFSDALANGIIAMNMNFTRGKFSRADMSKALLYNNVLFYATLKNTDLSDALVYGNAFHQANCEGINLLHAILFANEFSNVNLKSATFNAGIMTKCMFDQTNLSGVNFSRAAISNCSFVNCKFDNVNVAGTEFQNVIFYDVDFSKTIGLDEAKFTDCSFGTKDSLTPINSVTLQLSSLPKVTLWLQKGGTALPKYSSKRPI